MKIFTLILALGFILVLSSCSDDKPTNNNNNNNVTYETVTIGNQVWMKKNLDVDHYRDGTPIPQITDAYQWMLLSEGACCYYNNDTSKKAIYGRLYNWYAVSDSRGLAPKGWHIPSLEEWTTLINYLGGESVAGGKLKEAGIVHWQSPNTGATNEGGFTGLPSGFRQYEGTFYGLGYSTSWWTSTGLGPGYAYSIFLDKQSTVVLRNGDNTVMGFPVRCIKD